MTYNIARALLACSTAFGFLAGAVVGLGGTALFVYLLITGQWFAAILFCMIGTPLIGMAVSLMVSAIGAIFIGLAHLVNRDAVRDAADAA